jgi:hypothetical protein
VEEDMKKAVLSLIVIGLFIGATAASTQAQTRPGFSLNAGVQTNLFKGSSFDNAWFTLDARLGIPLGRYLEISPEVMAAIDDSFETEFIWLYPGAMLNFSLGDFFVGGGAVLPIIFFDGGSESGNIAPKVNVGYRAGSLVLTAYIMILNEEGLAFLEFNYIGATIGFRF